MQYRELGKTGRALSFVGFGGIIVADEAPETAARWVAEAVERGVTYFDVAPAYGTAEAILGPALAPYRDRVFLACKTAHRDRAGAEQDLANSLKVLQTDHFDLYQFHSVTTMEDVEQILGPGGAMEVVMAAKQAGVIQHIGFSAHNEEAGLAMLARFPFDSVLYPVNLTSWIKGGFGAKLFDKAVELGIGILALKTLALRNWEKDEPRGLWTKTWYHPIEDPAEALLAARFTLSKPVTAAVSPGHMELFRLLCDAAEQFTPLTPAEEATLAQHTASGRPIFPLQG